MSSTSTASDPQKLLADALAAIRNLRAKLSELQRVEREPIAVVGMGCRLPGGVASPRQLWAALEAGSNLIEDVPADRWNSDAYYADSPDAAGKICTRRGGFVREVAGFDPAFFRISPREAAVMDPQHRVLLEIAWEALEHAGIAVDRLYGSETGVFVGVSSLDYSGLMLQQLPETELSPWFGTGMAHSAASGRISYTFGFRGPSMSIDTACSSSLVAVHLASESLRRGECNLALVGGVNLMLTPYNHIVFSRAHMLAPDGHCKTFDESADGYVRSDGAGIVVLKRLSDAIAAQDRIFAVIRGSAVNQDGPSGGLTVPNGPAQERVVRAALDNAGVNPADVGYVEAHGTGTALGDPIEINALSEVFSSTHAAQRPLLVGSVKTNLGHAEPASGVIGLIKSILQIDRGVIAPHLHLRTPSTRIAWQDMPVAIPTELTDWPTYGERRVGGVSSFGFTGTNAHVVLEQAPAPIEAPNPDDARTHHLLCLSARTPSALRALRGAYVAQLASPEPATLREICRAANAGRSTLAYRSFVVSDSRQNAARQLSALDGPSNHFPSAREKPRLAFLFTGQGAQYAKMGEGLYRTEPVFRAELERCDRVLRQHANWSLLDALYANPDGSLHQTRLAQPLIVSLELSLAALFRSWGIEPAFVAGHSVGEFAAACVAGAISVEDTLRLVYERARLMQALPQGGSMVAIQAAADVVEALIKPYAHEVSIAAVNGPRNTVLSGAESSVCAIVSQLEGKRIACRRLQVSHAFHSPLLEPMLPEFARVVRRFRWDAPQIPLVSNVSGALAGREILEPDYWVQHALAPVRFGASLETLKANGCRAFLEIGPRPTLLKFLGAPDANEPTTRVCSLDPARPDGHQVMSALGALFVAGAPVDFDAVNSAAGGTRVELPNYPFERERYWFAHPTAAARVSDDARHPLLGTQLESEEHPVFESNIGIEHQRYLADHRVLTQCVFPGSGYVELALSAARSAVDGRDWCIHDLAIEAPMVLDASDVRRVRTSLQPDVDGGGTRFCVQSRSLEDDPHDDTWETHARGRLEALPKAHLQPIADLAAFETRFHEVVPTEALYERATSAQGVHYGESFRALRSLRRADHEAFGKVELSSALAETAARYAIHPVLLDAGFHAVGALLPEASGTYLPTGIERVLHRATVGTEAFVHAVVRPADASSAGQRHVDITLYDARGVVTCQIFGLRLQHVSVATVQRALDGDIAHLAYELGWFELSTGEAAPADTRPAPRPWLVFTDEQGVGAGVADALAQRPQPVAVVVARPGGEPTRIGAARYAVDPARPEQIESLWRLLQEDSRIDPSETHVVYCWPLDLPALELDTPLELDRTLLSCAPLLEIAKQFIASGAEQPNLYVVTRGAVHTARAAAPLQLAQAPITGLIRGLRDELSTLRCRHVDLDPVLARRTTAGEAARLAVEILAEVQEEHVAFRAHQRFVARLERSRPTPRVSGPIAVELVEPGSPDNLRLAPATRRDPGPGEVEVSVRAVGANFKDVLYIWGLLETSSRRLGFECSGVVSRVGPGVETLCVGDAVIGLGTECLSHYVTLPAQAVFPKPSCVTFAEAAALPTGFLTAFYGLHELARLQPGESVLIHAAAGGVGQAALRLCQRLGVRIFATASHSKWDFLKAQGVDDVMNSRTLDFREQILQATDGRGVDVVLNSLNGDFIPATLDVLARGGRFVEIGKRGIWSSEEIAGARPDASYFTFDLGEADSAVARLLPEMFETTCAWLNEGTLAPLPVQRFPVEHVSDAFRQLSQGKNVGKIVVEFAALDASGDDPRARPFTILPDATYLITGGLGDLGLEVAEWLVAHGARELVLVGRSAASEHARARITRLQELGARVGVRRADVAVHAEIRAVLDEIHASGMPLRGIVHAAGLVDDARLPALTRERCLAVMNPKIAGTWNLHTLTQDVSLDFFVCFSSIVSTLPSAGQSAYSAANAFMDALMLHRKVRERPALSIGFGPWAGVGMAARLSNAAQNTLRARGVNTLSARKYLRALEHAMGQSTAHVLVAALNWRKFARRLAPKPVPVYLESVAGPQALGADAALWTRDVAHAPGALRRQVASAVAAERRPLLVATIRATLAQILGFSSPAQVDPRCGFFDLGIDSLSALEAKNRLSVALDFDLPTTALLDFATSEALAAYVHDDVLGYAASAGAPAATRSGTDNGESTR